MEAHTLVLYELSHRRWPALAQPGHLERCQAILDAIVWMTEAEDLPTAIELVYLGTLENWAAARGDVDAIASAWALRKYL